jgi:hypothetical protein
VIRTPTSRNYEGYDFALGQLSPEKREIVQAKLETYLLEDDAMKTLDRPSYVQAYKQRREEFNSALMQMLTAVEFERYEINSTPAGTELARRVIGMDPTDDEMITMYRLAYKCWTDSGGVYGLWHAIRVPAAQIAQAEHELDTGIQQALGSDRYLDYQMATSTTGQQLRNLAARYDLSRDTLGQAFALQSQADQSAKQRYSSAQGPFQSLDLLGKLQQVMGPDIWQAWQAGRNLRVDLDP